MSEVIKINEEKKKLTKDIFIISVTDITSKKNPKNKKYLVETNLDSYQFDEDTIIKFMLFKDKEFTKAEFNKVLKEARISEAFHKAIVTLSRSKKTTYEIREYLRGHNNTKNDYEEDIIDEVIKRLHEFHFLSDLDYAKNYLIIYGETKGPKWIRGKFETKRIHQDIINEVLKGYDGEETKAFALATKWVTNSDLSKYPLLKQKQKLLAKLVQNGFSSSTSQKVIEKLNLVDESSEELTKDYQKIIKRLEGKELDAYEKKQKIIASLMQKGYAYDKIKEVIKNK